MVSNDQLTKELKALLRDLELDRKQCLADEKANRQQAKRHSELTRAVDGFLAAEFSMGAADGYKNAIDRLRFILRKR